MHLYIASVYSVYLICVTLLVLPLCCLVYVFYIAGEVKEKFQPQLAIKLYCIVRPLYFCTWSLLQTMACETLATLPCGRWWCCHWLFLDFSSQFARCFGHQLLLFPLADLFDVWLLVHPSFYIHWKPTSGVLRHFNGDGHNMNDISVFSASCYYGSNQVSKRRTAHEGHLSKTSCYVGNFLYYTSNTTYRCSY